jgi:hypothetical protein
MRVSYDSAVQRDLQHAPARKPFHSFEHTKFLCEVRAMFPNPRHNLKTISPHSVHANSKLKFEQPGLANLIKIITFE